MALFSVLRTERLVLRRIELADAAQIQRLAAAREIAEGTLTIPHPYEDGMAEEWIEKQRRDLEADRQVTWAVTLAGEKSLIGTIGLILKQAHRRAELGYWIGVPYWGRGYCTEAALTVIGYGFEVLELHRIHAHHFRENPASGRVMRKIGMRPEGCLREHVIRFGRPRDLDSYGLLKSEWREKKPTG